MTGLKSSTCTWMRVAALGLGVVAVAGCRTEKADRATVMRDGLSVVKKDVFAPQYGVIGSVVHVNRDYNYAVVRCTLLPYDEEEANVYVRDDLVGRVRVAGPRRPPYVTVDIVSGEAPAGARVVRDRTARDRGPM